MAALALSACGSSTKPEASGSPSPSATATPTPTVDARPTPASSKGPARNIPKPVLPEAAKKNTEAGFKAFTQYWFDTVTYALETGDSQPLKKISKPDCKICNGYIDRAAKISAGAGWEIAPQWTLRGFVANMKLDPLGQAAAHFLLEESASTRFDKDGKVLKSYKASSSEDPRVIYAVFDGSGWRTAQAGNA
ncbi:DUF6318 family protein [Sinomonas halotolerans]|uniref:DUF6318 family protein n=1 Tax=Sinomonas halotolerans TaxID=1644133 RepID=A0ABU9WZD2_9MICC